MTTTKKSNMATDIMAVKQTPLPQFQMACVLFVQICEALNVNVLFPFVAFMVEDMGYTGEALGYHAGLLAAAFCFAQFCTAVPWGMVSDRFGRKPAILIGTMGSGIGMLLFGLARTFPQAIAARIFSGLLSGNLGVVKSLLTEITDDTNRGPAFSYMSLAWAIGCVIAPLAGGMLCRPSQKYPSVFPDHKGYLFADYPYLLPCLVCLTWSTFSATFCACFMIETRKQKKPKKSSSSQKPDKKSVELTTMASFDSTGSLSTKTGYSSLPGGTIDYDDDELSQHTVELHPTTSTTVHSPLALTREEDDDLELGTLHQQQQQSSPDKGASRLRSMQTQLQHAMRTHTQETRAAAALNTELTNKSSKPTPSSLYSALPTSSGGGSSSNKNSFVIDGGSDDDSDGDADLEAQKCVQRQSNQNKNTSGTMDIYTKQPLQQHRVEEPHSGVRDRQESIGDEEEEINESEEMCCGSCLSPSTASTVTTMDSSSHNLKEGNEGRVPVVAKGKLSTAMVLRQRVVVLATGNYGMLCAASILVEETLPLFLKAEIVDGGFGFNSMRIGFLLSISGCVMLLFTSFVLPVLSKRSKFWMFKVGTIGSIPVTILFPLIALMNRTIWANLSETVHTWLLWTILPLVTVLKSVFVCFAFSAVMIQVNHSVTDEYLGAVNGLGQSMAALARAIGPALGGALWSLSVHHHFVYLNFIVTALAFCFCLYLNQLLPASLDFKKQVKNKKQLSSSSEIENDDSGSSAPIFH